MCVGIGLNLVYFIKCRPLNERITLFSNKTKPLLGVSVRCHTELDSLLSELVYGNKEIIQSISK